MKKILFTLIIFLFLSCKNNRVQYQPNNPETPAVLQGQENSDSKFLFSKSYSNGREDMVQLLYSDLIKRDSSLKNLSNSIIELEQDKDDTLKIVSHFTENNSSYYSSATLMINSIKDSLLRSYIKSKVDLSERIYGNRVSDQNANVREIQKLSENLADYYKVLKIVKTLPIIEKYQSDEKPSLNSLKQLEKRYKEIIQKVNWNQ